MLTTWPHTRDNHWMGIRNGMTVFASSKVNELELSSGREFERYISNPDATEVLLHKLYLFDFMVLEHFYFSESGGKKS